MMQKGAFWALNKGIVFDASKKPKEKAKAAEYFQASAELYEKVLNSSNPQFPGKESWAAATYKNVGIAYGRLQHIPDNSRKMALAFEIYLARSDPKVDPADQRFEMHRCVPLGCFELLFVKLFILRNIYCNIIAVFVRRLVTSYRTTVGYGESGPNEEQALVR
jgi:hypothetical protein